MQRLLINALMTAAMSAALASCATISEEACLAGDWESIGFKDGENGKSRARLADISQTCGKYNVIPDRTAYLRGLEEGLTRYCTPQRGYDHGRDGRGVNNECTVRGFGDYIDAHAEGFVVYEIEQDYHALIARWEETDKARRNVEGRLLDETLEPKERKRLEKKQRRLERRAENVRIDIRAMERLHGFGRWYPDV